MIKQLLFFHFALILANPGLTQNYNYPDHFQPKGFGGGGYTYSPSISPYDADLLFLVCDMGGVYRSSDQGQTWSIIHSTQLVSTVKGKIQFTSDPNQLYAVRRNVDRQNDPWFRGTLAKSYDAGNTWIPIPDPTETGVHRLEVDPGSTQRLLLNEYNRLFFSSDGGTSWQVVFQPSNDQVWLGGAFWKGDTILAGTNHGLLVSTNSGQSFQLETHTGLPAGTGIYQLSGAWSGNSIRLFAIAAPSDRLYAWTEPREVKGNLSGIFNMEYSSDADWSDSRGNIPASVEISCLALSRHNAQIVWAEGNEPNDFPHTYRSVDGGLSWQDTYFPDNNENIRTGWAGADGPFWTQFTGGAWGIAVAEQDPDFLLKASGYGEMTTDGGLHWRSTYVRDAYLHPEGLTTPIDAYYASSGLDVTSSHQLFWKNTGEMFLANTDVGLTYSPDTGNTWTWARNTFYDYGPVANNNWYRIVQRPDNQHLFAATSTINDIYLGYRLRDEDLAGAGGLLLRSVDGGVHFDTLHNFGHPVVWLEMDPQNPDRMWVSVVDVQEGGIFRTDDGGQTWTKLPAPARTEGHPYNLIALQNGGLLASYSARALDDAVTLTESSGVFYSPDGGENWLDRSDPAMHFYLKDLAMDPLDTTQKTWYACVWGRFTAFPGPNNQGNGGLYRTTDAGSHWERIFSNESVESITIHPFKSGRAYVSVENDGLYFTQTLNDADPVFEKIQDFPFWRPKRVFYQPENPCEVWVCTMGGGLWKGESPRPVADFHFTADGRTLSFQNASQNAEYVYWEFGDGFATSEFMPQHSYVGNGTYSVTLTVENGCSTSRRTQTVVISDTGDAEAPVPRIQLFPNPASGITLISGLPEGARAVMLEDILGRETSHFILSGNQLDLSGLPPGCYRLQFGDGLQMPRNTIVIVAH